MAPTPSKLSSNAEGKKPIASGVQKKKGKEPLSLEYLLLRAMRQNVGMENEQLTGWGLVQGHQEDDHRYLVLGQDLVGWRRPDGSVGPRPARRICIGNDSAQ